MADDEANPLRLENSVSDRDGEEDMELEDEEEDEDEPVDGGDLCTLLFDEHVHPSAYLENDSSDIQLYERLQRVDDEIQAERNRAMSDQTGSGSRNTELKDADASFVELMESMNSRGLRKPRKCKKRGRKKGSRNKTNSEIRRMIGDANLNYTRSDYGESISILKEVVRMAPNMPEPYHVLGLVYSASGDSEKSLNCYMLAAYLMPRDSTLWKLLVKLSLEKGNAGQAMYCLSRAITSDPSDLSLRFLQASVYLELEDNLKAAESYARILSVSPDNIEAVMKSAELFQKCRKVEIAIDILEKYLNDHHRDSHPNVIGLLADICMDNALYDKPMKHIESARSKLSSSDSFPLTLAVKEGICNIHEGNEEKAEVLFRVLNNDGDGGGDGVSHRSLSVTVGDAYMSLDRFQSALRYYLPLIGKINSGGLHRKIAKCYLGLREKSMAVIHLRKSIQECEGDIEARLSLSDLLLQEGEEDEAISFLRRPPSGTGDRWWEDGEVRLKLSRIYRSIGMNSEFVDLVSSHLREILIVGKMEKKKRKQSTRDLRETIGSVDDRTATVFRGFRPLTSSYKLSKVARAKKTLQRKEDLKEERRAAGMDCPTDSSGDDLRFTPSSSSHRFTLKDDDGELLIELCRALETLERYEEAMEFVNAAMKHGYKSMSEERRTEAERIGARICYMADHVRGKYECVKRIVENHPGVAAAWNCYYAVVSRLELRHSKFLNRMRERDGDCVPTMLISGHHFTAISQHQAAAREYLEAYRRSPDNALVNLCVGTSLINLALGLRVQNRHLSIMQGIAFLHNNLRPGGAAVSGQSQEALFNVARAYQHVGLLSLAAAYYEKVLRIREHDRPFPHLPYEKKKEPPPPPVAAGHCDLRREAAYNLHLIYRASGAVDLARQILKDHCSF